MTLVQYVFRYQLLDRHCTTVTFAEIGDDGLLLTDCLGLCGEFHWLKQNAIDDTKTELQYVRVGLLLTASLGRCGEFHYLKQIRQLLLTVGPMWHWRMRCWFVINSQSRHMWWIRYEKFSRKVKVPAELLIPKTAFLNRQDWFVKQPKCNCSE